MSIIFHVLRGADHLFLRPNLDLGSKFNARGALTLTSFADTKIILISEDDDNYSLISFRDKSGNELAKMGYNPQNGVCINNATIVTNTDLQAGKDSIKREIDKTVSKYIAFPRPFSVIPVVTVNAETVVLETRMHATNITSSGFTLYVASGNSDTVMTIDWIAVLP